MSNNILSFSENIFNTKDAKNFYIKKVSLKNFRNHKSLNLNFSKKFGKEDNFKFNLGFKNILNSKRQMVTQSYESNEEIYSSFSPGRELHFKLSIDLK